MDTGLAAWDMKIYYDFIRPVTLFRQGVPPNPYIIGPDSLHDQSWTSTITTPNFQEYPSGHSSFSACAAQILSWVFGRNVKFTVPAHPSIASSLTNTSRSFTSFRQAAEDAGRSRIFGGVHFSFSNVDGQLTCTSVANHVLSVFSSRTFDPFPSCPNL
mmetsp:Transcript_29200/g.47141  ORF Transcript_29200/g.47141 Transcript_29200/m.47141 type:complete len:158 (-) Transcript_29200:199-672(-)